MGKGWNKRSRQLIAASQELLCYAYLYGVLIATGLQVHTHRVAHCVLAFPDFKL